ncbi:hypothetical protein PDE_07005 [Penicillium oxalicum 114-2]|uniref:Carrier domain-containing protein n=1 Tax=Penicillium oxalicum (strain 114-2 / CGMCC 5302) TaxID=933388 RepID=S7ZTF4_PENO1|nr:hypothetical protein PDE_07005 [Penicillium oxalicum 114-2]
MTLVQQHHQAIDLLSHDPFDHAEVLNEKTLRGLNDVDEETDFEEWPVTPAQAQILESDEKQWCRISLILPRNASPDVARIRSAWKQLCSLHCCLRAVVRTNPISGQTFQRVLDRTPDIQWNTDRATSNNSSRSSQFETTGDEDVAQLVVRRDPSGGLRLTIYARRALVDGTSLELIKRNLARLYCDLPVAEHTPLASYHKFLEHTKDATASAEFWKTQLRGAVPPRALPWSTKIFDIGQIEERNAVTVHIDENSHPGLARLEHATGLRRKLIYETLWAYILHCHSGAGDVLFAAVERDASFSGTASCVGYLDHTYPIRVTLDSEETFATLADKIDNVHQSASTHAFIGYDKVTQHLRGQVESIVRYSPDGSGPIFAGQCTGFPLLFFINGVSPATLTLCYSTLTRSSDAQLLLDHFSYALHSALDKFYLPNTILQKLDLASRDEQLQQVQIARSLAQPRRTYTITKLFEEQVERTPNAPAVQFEENAALSFAELNALANRASHALYSRDIRGQVVPVCIERSTSLIIAILAVLKAGAAYTVLDPAGPVERNQSIINTCSAKMVLTTSDNVSLYPGTVALEDLIESTNEMTASSNLDLAIKAQDRCYIVFTSGSTGAPKGAVLTHGAATNGMHYHSLKGLQRWLLFYNPTFSAAQRTMLSTLVHGGTLLLASKERMTSNLADIIRSMQVEALGITPSALSIIKPEEVPSLKRVILVGEKITRELVVAWADAVELRNTYGLSECAQLNFGTRLYPSSNPGVVGLPSDTTQVFILKPGTTELTPMGVSGELCLAGPQLASGYLTSGSSNSDVTSSVFIPNPFGAGVMYRTRDIARMHADGVEILGRLDFQAKINGQKINPVEVDRVLSQHSRVNKCAVVAVDMREKLTLVAAIVPSSGQSWPELVASMKELASEKLPAFMIPSLWMQLDVLPTNSNGKTDVRAIRAQALEIGWESLVSATFSSASQTITDPVESRIARTWADILSLQATTIRRESSFIALGGTSIEAIKAINELRKNGVSVDLGDLLNGSSLESVAKQAEVDADAEQELEPFSLVSNSKLRQELEKQDGVLDAYPATPLQEGLLATIEEDESMYNYRRVWDISNLDKTKLRAAFLEVFGKSDILRTSFVPDRRSFLQVLRNDVAFPWVEVDKNLDDYMEDSKNDKFTLDGPLARFTVTLDDRLVVTTHHSLFDFWSHRFLYQDVSRVYLGLPLSPRTPFKNFVRYLAKSSKAEQDAYWHKYLEGVEPSILNTVPQNQTSVAKIQLPWDQGRQVLTKNGLSAGSVLYAAWGIVLSHHIRQLDVAFVTTLSGRDAPVTGIESIDGPTLTVVPQRVTLDPESTLISLTHSIRDNFLRTLKHAHHGIRNALAAAQLNSSSFDTMVNILVKDEDTEEMSQVFHRYGERPVWQSEFTTLEIEEIDNALQISLSSQMEPRRVKFLLDSYAKVLQQFVKEPSQRVRDLQTIGTEEMDFLYNTISNRESLHIPAPSLLHERFENFALETPDVVAIDWDSEIQVTYKQLDTQANLLANYLVSKGVQVGDAVPLMLNKSIDTMVAILGVMKAGAAYVPLSPDNPIDRNAFIAKDVKARFIIVHDEFKADVDGLPDLEAIDVNDAGISEMSPSSPQTQVCPEDIAYIIYTSGSTGLPKGVMVPHRAATAAVASMAVAEGRYAGEWRTVQFANYVFDASVQDIFNTLSTGGTLCMAPSDKMQSDLPGVINEMNAHQAILTPTVARLMDPEEIPSFHTLIVGGEPLTPDIIAKWSPGHRILNVYGPTETSMVITTKDVDPAGRPSNIGAPFPTVMGFVLDPNGTDLVPYGAVGELCVAGPQVTAGYVGRDDLTKAAFLENVLDTPKMYRTGDLARWLPGGELECLGRKDNQVKIHGHRIELAEIEQTILKTELVQGTAVLAITIKGNKHLVAVCVFNPGPCEILKAEDHADVARELRASLSTLASYMIPKYIIPVGDFPKSPSRKTDRKVLTRWIEQLDAMTMSQFAFEGSGIMEEVVPVETKAEQTLQEIWSDVLGIPMANIGKNSDFLALGGDSVAAISATSLARKAGYALGVKNVLKTPVLSDLAELMRTDERQNRASSKPAYQAPPSVLDAIKSSNLNLDDDVEYVYPCPPGQVQFLEEGERPEQMWVLMAARVMPESVNMNDWVVAVRKLTEANDILRTSWIRVNRKEWAGVVLKSSDLDLMVVPCANEDERSAIVEAFWEERFQFGNPFIKYAILEYPDGQWETVIKMNHAAYDGTLLRIFDEHFGAILKGTPLPPHGQFKDFATHIYQSDRDSTLQFWKETMQGKSYSWPAASNPKVNASVRQMVTRNLETTARAHGVTVSIIFQAAYQIWLAKASGQTDISFDYLLSGRNVDMADVDPQTVNGTLANFLPVRSNLDFNQSLKAYLEGIQDMFWAITENGNVGLNDIYDAAELSRDTARNNCLFLYQPFQPSANSAEELASRWLVMAKSKVRMFQPYALVVEVSKAPNNEHRLTIMYDSDVFEQEAAQQIATEIIDLTDKLAEVSSGSDSLHVLQTKSD